MAKKYDESEGVWRTIGGRRVFIRKGQSLEDAMRESGKFKKKDEDTKNKKTGYENFEIGNGTNKISGMYNKEKDEVYYTIGREQYKKKISELKDEEFPYTNDGIVKDYITKSNKLQDEKIYQVDTTKLKGKYFELPERTEEEKASDERYANAKMMYKITGDEKYKEEYQKEIEESTERIRKKVEERKKLSSFEKAKNMTDEEKLDLLNWKPAKDGSFEEYKRKKEAGTLDRMDYTKSNVDNEEYQVIPIYDKAKSMKEEGIRLKDVVEQSNDTFEVGDLKRKALETLPKDHIDSHEGDLYIKKTPQSTELLNKMKDKDSGLLSTFKDQQTGEEWYDVPFANMEDNYKSDRLKYVQENDKKMLEDYNKAKSMGVSEEKATITSLTKRAKESGNDYLPKASKVMTAGNSNRKEVSDNIQAHILEHYDNPVDFMEQMDAFDYLPTKWKAGEEIAKGGSYLIYNEDMANYLNDLNINPKGKKFSEEKSFEMYTSLVGRESEKLYNKLEKLFEQYKKEHKNSNATLEDFRKWFK